jgi:HicB family
MEGSAMASDTIKLNLRLPKGLHRRLTQQARRSNVSLNTEIINQLEGREAASIQQTADAIQPLLENTKNEVVRLITASIETTLNPPPDPSLWPKPSKKPQPE